MKPKSTFRRLLPLTSIVLVGAFASHAALAETYTWGPTTGGTYNWDNNLTADPLSTENNWGTDPAGGFPKLADDIATITKIPSAAVTINLNQTITLGTLNIGATGTVTAPTGRPYTINAEGGSLIMEVTEGSATIAKNPLATWGKSVDTINADIQLNDDLILYSGSYDTQNNKIEARGYLVINGVISGTGKSVTKTGANLVRLVGDQLYDGGTIIDAGTLELGSGAGGNATVAGDIVINENGTLLINNGYEQTLSDASYSGTGSFRKTGNGTLNLTGTWNLGGGASSVFHVGSAVPTSASTIVDATAVPSFTFSGTQFYVGAGPSGVNDMTGTLKLGILNTITANQVTIGGLEPDSNGNGGHAGLVTTLEGGTTTIHAANMALGTGKANGARIAGQLGGKFTLGAGATLNLYGLTGSGSRAALVLGRVSAENASRGKGAMELAEGTANLVLSELSLGKVTALVGLDPTNPITGTLTLGTSASNHLDISGVGSVVKIGYRTAGGGTTAVGTLTIDNLDSTSSITSEDNSTAILIGHRTEPSGVVDGTCNFYGGTLKITTGGAAIAGGGGTTCALDLAITSAVTLIAGADSADWIHSLTTANIGINGATIDTAGFNLGISQAFSGAGGLTKDGAGTLTLSGVSTYTGNTTVSAGTLALADNGGLKFVVTDGGTSNQITGVGSVTLDGDFTIDISAVTDTIGSWQLVDTGSQSFTPNFTVAGGWAKTANVWELTVGSNIWQFSELTGTLTLTQGEAGDDYSAWDDLFEADLSDKAADFDGDGMSNFEEYAFGLDPTSGTSVNPLTDLSTLKSAGTFSYTRRAGTGLIYTVWASTDLVDWGTEPVAVTEEAGAPVDGVETVVVELPGIPTEVKYFVRVKAQ